jgi:ATP-dependent Lon protease
MTSLRLVPLDDTVLFPGMSVTLAASVGDDERVVLVPRHDQDFAEIGVVADVTDRIKLPGGARAISVDAQHRALIGAAQTGADGDLFVEVEERPDAEPNDKRTRELVREYRAVVQEILELRGADQRIAEWLRAISEPGALADSAGYSPDLDYVSRLALLRELEVTERLQLAVNLQRERLAELQIRKRIRDDVQEGADKQQREYFLRKQMESIRKELGEDDASVVDEYRKKIEEAQMPEEVQTQALKELGRLERMGESTGESSMIRSYLDWLIAVPWSKRSDERLDPVGAREVLDHDHFGLADVKDRITEYLAVRKLRQDRGIKADPKSGAILTLIGPPGTGKTSIGESIARATGREFVRMSLGGVRDEAEIRGHRRTYIGALPGQIIQMMKKAGTRNPVFMLDEVDKMSMDFRGDPSAALLEVLDPEQNFMFVDHYLDVEYDLSQVFFIATANVLHTVPPALQDRMEVIRLSGYTELEKMEIAKRFLVRKQMEQTGLGKDQIEFADDGLNGLIQYYTREAGVRNLEREIGNLCRKVARQVVNSESAKEKKTVSKVVMTGAKLPELLGPWKFRDLQIEKKNEVGAATGLAWTEVGGQLLTVECTLMEGKGKLTITGKLGDVMQESAQAAMSYIRSRAHQFGLPRDFYRNLDVHIHVPEGAIPKDGPSAGITLATTICSALTRIPVRCDVAMTGEITLRGKVLGIGGLKEKLMAAHRHGILEAIVPRENEKDLPDLPDAIKKTIKLHFVDSMDEVLKIALERRLVALPMPAPIPVVEGQPAEETVAH